jgi:hypothetical protein
MMPTMVKSLLWLPANSNFICMSPYLGVYWSNIDNILSVVQAFIFTGKSELKFEVN